MLFKPLLYLEQCLFFRWLQVNGEAIYGSRPWTHQNDTLNGHVWYTKKNQIVYAIVLQWPENDVLKVRNERCPKDEISNNNNNNIHC